MKWIVLAIVVVIVPYTVLRWHYRKPGRAFEPYQDIKDRANTMRLLSAGFQRITLEATRPIDAVQPASAAAVSGAPGGLPAPLAATLVESPLLPAEIVHVSAGGSINAMFAYPIEFTCSVPDNHQQFAGAELYIRGESMFVLPQFERLKGGLLARTRQTFGRLVVPPGALKPGRYHVTLVGARSSRTWTLEVR